MKNYWLTAWWEKLFSLLINKKKIVTSKTRSEFYWFFFSEKFFSSRGSSQFWETLSLSFELHTMAGITVKDVNAHGTIVYSFWKKVAKKKERDFPFKKPNVFHLQCPSLLTNTHSLLSLNRTNTHTYTQIERGYKGLMFVKKGVV